MSYYTERHGMRNPIKQTYEIDSSKYAVLLGCCENYYDNIAWKYPVECEDGLGCCGLDKYRLADEMKYEIPDLYIDDYGFVGVPRIVNNMYNSGHTDLKYNQYALLDFIEFMYDNIYDIVKIEYHQFFNHYHLRKLSSKGIMIKFLTDINACFTKTGLLYKLTASGEVERVISNDVVTPDIVNKVLNIEEKGTRELLQEAIYLHRSHDPSAARDSVEKIWDAFERMKTYYRDLDKKESITQIVSNMAGGSVDYRDLIEEEFTKLTKIGNTFRIRHHETNKIEITDIRYYDYFFNRCLSLIALAVQYLK